MRRLENKVAIITGSSRGIGKEVAKLFAGEGAKVIINYVGNKAEADQTVSEINTAGNTAFAIQADISKVEECTKLFDETTKQFGKVDILVNNAGINIYKLLKDVTEEDFDRLFNINVKGTFFMMKEAATKLENNGRIINFSTTIKRLMVPTYSTYTATKAAVEQLTRVFAKEIGSRGITVNSVSPGPTDTPLFRQGKTEEDIRRFESMAGLGRLGTPEDIAKVVLLLASDEASWISGENVGANGGVA